MEQGKPSKTALRVAIRRAAHQRMDRPPVLEDPIVTRLFAEGHARDMDRASEPVARDFRAFLAARSRHAEEHLAEAFDAGVRQYAVLGAGLDTFAYRNPHHGLRVFEVDFPATQQWKRSMLAEVGIAPPETLSFVPLDFEHKTLAEGLEEAGFDRLQPAFFSWLGVVPYLTRAGFVATLNAVAAMAPGSGLCFDYAFPPETLSPARQRVFAVLAERVARAGEPFQLFFSQQELEATLHEAGFCRVEQVGPRELNELYFKDRADGLRLSLSDMGSLATAWLGERNRASTTG